MKLPNAENAIVPIEKLEQYCLNPEHDEGKHKARVFHRALNLGIEDSIYLREVLLKEARSANAILAYRNQWGEHYFLDFIMEHAGNRAEVRSKWTVLTGENFPRLTSCYVKRKVRE